jgi:hypothetical protein
MDEFKKFIKVALGAVALLLTIASGAGAISWGVSSHQTIYIAVGIINILGWGGLIVYTFVRWLKKSRE